MKKKRSEIVNERFEKAVGIVGHHTMCCRDIIGKRGYARLIEKVFYELMVLAEEEEQQNDDDESDE